MRQLSSAIAEITEPVSQSTLGELGAEIKVTGEGEQLNVSVTLGAFNPDFQRHLRQQLNSMLPDGAQLELAVDVPDCLQGRGEGGLDRVKTIIAVASGKGGVGKSATAANLALALQQDGARVGLLDADIYGPSVPVMMDCQEQTPSTADGKMMQPVRAHEIYINSMGFFMQAQQAAVWRGPMASGALQQLIRDTDWPALDYLVVDMPPGTGDIQLTLSQKVPVTTAVVVTTPQELALSDARRGIDMFTKVNIDVAGIVENMSFFQCPCCDHREPVFGQGGGEALAADSDTRLLGKLPLDSRIRADADSGRPTVIAAPDSDVAAIYRDIARQIGTQIWRSAKASAMSIPTISIED